MLFKGEEMYYFVPAWYNPERQWYDNTALWFRVFERISFDDTVNQIKMFQNAQEASCLLVLNYQPQLRYFLHKQGLLGTDYWSFFDDIQNISATTTNPISFKTLEWQEGTYFIYTPFAVVAKCYDEIVAYIHFAENGNLFYIDFQKNERSDKQYVYDDRGFLSSILYFDEQGNPYYQDYLNEKGKWQFREYLNAEYTKIVINEESDHHFNQTEYSSWETLISERMAVLKKEVIKSNDTIVTASHQQHNTIILQEFEKQKKVFSFFGKRYDVATSGDMVSIANASSLLITDTETQEKNLIATLRNLGTTHKSVTRISPFDTRLRLGRSQILKSLIIYFYIDNLSEKQLKNTILTLLNMMNRNLLIELKLVTFNQQNMLQRLKQWISEQIYQYFVIENFFERIDIGENQLEEESELELKRIECHCFSNDIQLIEALDTARLVIDLGKEPDLYTQIASISAGVPQINAVCTDYVEHLKNGWILEKESELESAIRYYFDGLSNWNQSLVYSVQKMADYTSGRILKQWKELLERD